MSVRHVGKTPHDPAPGLLERQLGTNEAPLTKIADFEKTLDELGGGVDVAFFKFCYVDFNASTDTDALFTEYEAAMSRLSTKYPKVTFLHVTAPLTVVQGGLKGWAKRTLGSGAWGERENVKRNAFNERLRAAHPGAVFDLANIEATRADGKLETYEIDGATTPKLRADFTDDGGHLNSAGRRRVASALLDFLAKVGTGKLPASPP